MQNGGFGALNVFKSMEDLSLTCHSIFHVLLLSWQGFICPTFLLLSRVLLAPFRPSPWLPLCQQLVGLPACSSQPSTCCLWGADGTLTILGLVGL